MLLHHYMGEIDGAFRSWGFARGGTGAISNAIGDARAKPESRFARRRRLQKFCKRTVAPRASCSKNGDEIQADVVSSSVDPRLTFMKMIGEEYLPDDFCTDLNATSIAARQEK